MQQANKTEFRGSEGIELMLMIIREKKFASKCAVNVLDFVLTNDPANCDRCVEVGGLKSTFPVRGNVCTLERIPLHAHRY